MVVTASTMENYKKRLRTLNEKAANEVLQYMQSHNYDIDDAFITFAHAIATKYGEAAGALACQMYDELRQYWKTTTGSTKKLRPAEPARVATRSELEKAIYGTLTETDKKIPGTVSRLVKQAAEDTTLNNAIRDGAEFAWIPAGESCAFCLTLASRGWQRASKKALKNGHAEHIHANCDCTYTIRFDRETQVAGYDPQRYLNMWDDADGKNAKEKLRSMRKMVSEDKIGKY